MARHRRRYGRGCAKIFGNIVDISSSSQEALSISIHRIGQIFIDEIFGNNADNQAIGEKAYWSQGHGTDAVRLLLRYGFNELNLNRICLHVYSFNTRAIRCYEKAGFVLEGRLRQDVFHHGEYADALVMSVLRSEWRDTEI